MNGNGTNGHSKYGAEESGAIAPARPASSVASMLAAVFALLALVMSIVAVALVAGQGSATAASDGTEMTCPAVSSCHDKELMTSLAPNAAGALPGVAMAYNNESAMALMRYGPAASVLKPIGAHTALLAEATDAGANFDLVKDGQSGDTEFPFGSLKPLLTIGEYDPFTGYMPVGVPDGQGIYRYDNNTIRYVFQAESYGYVSRYPTWPMPVNGGAAHFTGSHVTYVDYDKDMLAGFFDRDESAAPMVRGAGPLIESAINLAGNPVGAFGDPTAAHYGDTAADGTYVSIRGEESGWWTYHSFCSAHLAERHQWGEGLGGEDDLFMTNEEWTEVDPVKVAASGFVGLSPHAIDMTTKTAYAVGAMGMGGYEKIVEFNCGVPGYVCWSESGYNGAFGDEGGLALTARRSAVAPLRSDGTSWAVPENVVPARVYIGAKGYSVDGTPCGDACGFLERNGLAHGKVFGFAVDTSVADRDAFHKNNDREQQTEMIEGLFAPTEWKWDGVVKDFEFDQAWEFQEPPVVAGSAAAAGWDAANLKFWTAQGRDTPGAKTEHNSPDPRGNARFMQGSTGGYFGIYDMTAGAGADSRSLADVLGALAPGQLPDGIPAKYELVEGEIDVTHRINLGGKGLRADGGDQTMMHDSSADKKTFEDIDGLEWLAAAGGKDYIIVQEDGGNLYGERSLMFELPTAAGANPQYFFVAQAGGAYNTRSVARVGVPAGTAGPPTSTEFSGIADVSGALRQTELGGHHRRAAEAEVPVNDKIITLGLQMHSLIEGVVSWFRLDRGGQVYAFKPNLP